MRLLRVTPAEALLRIALALSFIYPAVAALTDEASWLGYFPQFATDLFRIIAVPLKLSDTVLLHAFGLVEVILAGWVLFGKRVRVPALIMAALLLAIVLTNLGQFDVLFRDVSLMFVALALALRRPPSHTT